MKIVIIGPGALGSLFAACLAACKDNDVWLLDHDAARAARIDGHLLLTTGKQEVASAVSATADAARIGPAELVLHCVKSHDVVAGLEQAASLFTPDTTLISFQNGISHLEALLQIDLPLPPAIGVTSLGATLKKPGHVLFGGQGMTRIGFLQHRDRPSSSSWPTSSLDDAATLFNRAGLATESVGDILHFVWSKLLINVGINALTVIFNCKNGKLLTITEAREKLAQAVEEAATVAHASGITLGKDPVQQTLAVCKATADNVSSMLQDVRQKRPTEIGAINGALLKKAEELGIAAPVNRHLVSRVRAIEAAYLHQELPDSY